MYVYIMEEDVYIQIKCWARCDLTTRIRKATPRKLQENASAARREVRGPGGPNKVVVLSLSTFVLKNCTRYNISNLK